MIPIGQRICIIGPSCSGKSTLADKLAKKLSYPLLHLDQIAHYLGTNWVKRPKEETRSRHDDFIKNPYWIVDGQYKHLMPQRLKHADTLILIKVGRFRCLWRFIKRCLVQGDRPGRLEGATGEFNFRMVWWILYKQPKQWKQQMDIIAKHPHLNIIMLRSFKEIDSFLDE